MFRCRISLFAFVAALLAAETSAQIEPHGIWSYTSSVPNGKGSATYGSEYTYLEMNNNPWTYETGNVFNSFTDQLGNSYGYTYTNYNGVLVGARPAAIGYAGGGVQNLFYDSRANVWKQEFTGADGVSTITLEKSFPPACSSIVSCNKPVWTKDGLGNQTDYEYSTAHGGVLKVTAPAVNGVRPQTRYEYEQMQARYKNASGQIVASGLPVWMLVRERSCRAGAASGAGCALGASDEVIVNYDYGLLISAEN